MGWSFVFFTLPLYFTCTMAVVVEMKGSELSFFYWFRLFGFSVFGNNVKDWMCTSVCHCMLACTCMCLHTCTTCFVSACAHVCMRIMWHCTLNPTAEGNKLRSYRRNHATSKGCSAVATAHHVSAGYASSQQVALSRAKLRPGTVFRAPGFKFYLHSKSAAAHTGLSRGLRMLPVCQVFRLRREIIRLGLQKEGFPFQR